jgi:hypothetical protein
MDVRLTRLSALKRRLDNVKRRVVLAQKDAFSLPESPEIIRATHRICRRSVARFLTIFYKSNCVAGMLAVERSLKGFINRRGCRNSDVCQCTDLTQVVPPANKGQNLNHETRVTFPE